MTPFVKTLIAGMLASTLAACSSSDDDSSGQSPIDDRPGVDIDGIDDGAGDAGGADDAGTATGFGGTDDSGATTGGVDTGTTTGGADTGGVDTGTTTTGGTDTGTTTTGTTTGGTTTGEVDTGTTTTGGTTTGGAGTGGATTGGTDTDGSGTGGQGLPPIDVANSGGDRNSCAEGIVGRYNTTVSEVCSLAGPSRTDSSRTDERPSAPTGLTALLVGEDWIEIDWVPSVDNSEVVAYRIYRDGNLVRTLDQEPDAVNPIHEERDFRTTTYIDCNFTKNPACDSPSGVGRPGPGGSHVYQVSAVDDGGNESPLSAPATFELNTIDPNGSPPDLVAEGYEVTFFDDFDSDGFDEDDNWVTDLSFAQFGDEGRAVNGAQQYFVDARGSDRPENGFSYNPFDFRDGVLAITATETPPALLAAAGGQPYLSGAITTRSKVEPFTYGYVEMRAKVPSGNGLLSTFFLFQPTGNQYEIDIVEYLGREPDGATQNYHYRDGFRFADTGFQGVPHASPTMFLDTGQDLSRDFHVYSVLWEPGRVVYYIDGREVRRLTGPRVADVPMDIVAQFVVGTPNFAGDPTTTSFPASYEIDYIRVYQKP